MDPGKITYQEGEIYVTFCFNLVIEIRFTPKQPLHKKNPNNARENRPAQRG
jgi:hypothetical protein